MCDQNFMAYLKKSSLGEGENFSIPFFSSPPLVLVSVPDNHTTIKPIVEACIEMERYVHVWICVIGAEKVDGEPGTE